MAVPYVIALVMKVGRLAQPVRRGRGLCERRADPSEAGWLRLNLFGWLVLIGQGLSS